MALEVQILIVRHLSLKDALEYMEVCTVTHDAVYHVFAHRRVLDFASVLDNQNTVALPLQLLMTVLYAHTRAESIVNFCLNPSFKLLDKFSRYTFSYILTGILSAILGMSTDQQR